MIKMCRRSLVLIVLVVAAIVFSACGSSPLPNANVAATKPNANVANAPAPNVDSPVATNKKVELPTSNNAPTIGPVVQAYYAALLKKDDAALQNILSAAYLKKVMADAKAEKKPSIAAYLAELDLPDKPVEARNEIINGEKAVVEIKGGAYLNWTPFIYINEGGKWKFTGASPDIESVATDPNSKKK